MMFAHLLDWKHDTFSERIVVEGDGTGSRFVVLKASTADAVTHT